MPCRVIIGGGMLDTLRECRGLERLTDPVDLKALIDPYLRDRRARVRNGGDEPLTLQLQPRLADRTRADAKVRGERLLTYALPRSECTGQNQQTNTCCNIEARRRVSVGPAARRLQARGFVCVHTHRAWEVGRALKSINLSNKRLDPFSTHESRRSEGDTYLVRSF